MTPKSGAARTALYQILDAMTRMLAPILAFTSEEIWAAMPHGKGSDGSCVLLNDIPAYDEARCLSPEQAARWETVISLRDEVNKALEQARNEQGVKKNQDAAIVLHLSDTQFADWEKGAFLPGFDAADLAAIFIVSQVQLEKGQGHGYQSEAFPGMSIGVSASEAPKCSRCWNHNQQVDPETELCPRCAGVLKKIKI